ncbi:Lrp/AsnC family transcriptional regulator [Leucobacter albus]|uniref:Lrp/AsnC family transcriptional regulator n=1 Tax=Leucobacter albus TaxID=272210 RepID=A0ABW3TPF3_9MICO
MNSSQLKDQQIIRELLQDARQSNVAIAEKLGMSEGAVRRRIDRLVGDGIINFTVMAKPDYMGYHIHVLIRVETEPEVTEEVIEALSAMSELSYVYHCTGQFNLTLVGYFRDVEDLHSFTSNQLSKTAGIVSFRTVMVLRVAKRSQLLPPINDDE